jgi:alanyl-tRNA synthetase
MSDRPTTADELRRAFLDFFIERAHSEVPSASVIPVDKTLLFTVAGMVPFKSYFTGEETAPYKRATSSQKCIRAGGKHNDLDDIGRTNRHFSFFEMLGNFSFGDYFKAEAIPLAWELLTSVLGLDGDRLWATVFTDDDDAAAIWRDVVGLPADRIQRMGEDNFWEMGETGPCGPCSEIYYDRGPAFGEAGGPAGGGEERYVEIWNLVFMQFDRQLDGSLEPLPRPNIDTGAGLERLLSVIEDVPSVWETDALRPIIAVGEQAIGQVYGRDDEVDVSLRILADHVRAVCFLVSDGVFPTNDGRGYVLRRIIRRAVLRAAQLGVSELVTPAIATGVIEAMGAAYPGLVRDAALIETVLEHEEEAFRRTLRAGSMLIEEEFARGAERLDGEVAFRLHDTYGFPIELTDEIARTRGVAVDREGFEIQMELQRARARAAGRGARARDDSAEQWRAVLEEFGPTTFVGYQELISETRVLAVVERDRAGFVASAGITVPDDVALVDVVLAKTPFYAEGGGQVGDSGTILGPDGEFTVLDTQVATEGLVRHSGYFTRGTIEPGALVTARVDAERRAAIRRNHTATHLLQAALRRVLGTHVQQQGSLVAPERLRFDFSHFDALTSEEIAEVESLVNAEVLEDVSVRTYETSRSQAEEGGAIAFFGEKYGDVVRVVEAGDVSVELCGGTHVFATGMIGPFRIVSESSIGANTRRIEATTGKRTIEDYQKALATLETAASTLRSTPDELTTALERLIEERRHLEDELRAEQATKLRDDARALRAANGPRLAARRDGLDPTALRELALMIRDLEETEAVALAGSPDGTRVALVVATRKGAGLDAKELAGEAARLVGGGGGGTPELATAGGRDLERIDDAVALLRERLGAG